MDHSIHHGGAIVDARQDVGTEIVDKVWERKRPGVTPPSRRAIQDVVQWIDEAEIANRTWARNALIVVAVVVALVLLAARLGLLPQ